MASSGGRASRGCDELDWVQDPPAAALVPRDEVEPGGLVEALLDPDAERAARVVRRAATRDADRFVDEVLPEAARRLGLMWLEDRVGFAEVTVASARLQAVLREVDPGPEALDGPLVAIVVPQGETHTLGPAVAAWRLRRAGASVMMLLACEEREALAALGGGDLSAVCLSSAAGGDGSDLAPLVSRLRAASGAPVLLGGAILDGRDPEALRLASGADGVGTEPEAALHLARETS